mmetsp:Transcript_22377/g.64303  ORF Transcript_22377/g.64303 Transcript_22377/m.64303 type:complete len:310 (-) Transcript_22377:622-1551(-)
MSKALGGNALGNKRAADRWPGALGSPPPRRHDVGASNRGPRLNPTATAARTCEAQALSFTGQRLLGARQQRRRSALADQGWIPMRSILATDARLDVTPRVGVLPSAHACETVLLAVLRATPTLHLLCDHAATVCLRADVRRSREYRPSALARLRNAHVREGVVGLPGRPVDRGQAPPLLIEGPVGMWAAAWGNAADVVHTGAAASVLPPLVGQLEDQASCANAAKDDTVLHELLRKHRRCVRLCHRVHTAGDGVVGVGAILSEEHRFRGGRLPSRKKVRERQVLIVVNAPHIDVRQSRDDVLRRNVAVD